ncbi:MAG: LytTR family DNA-binding domain-containing protein [Clostridiales bacterium]|jgi:DNA-binding LytR/AlgR family response regulator|nr:LytTR family DNA-binding domain-containing protein [Clostridiales bacterium]
MYTCYICDEDASQGNLLKDMFSNCETSDQWTVEVVNSARDLVKSIQAKVPDLILIDIVLGSYNGIECMKTILNRHPDIQVVFVSDNIEYCTSVYEVQHIYFLPKPFDEVIFKKAVAKAEKKIEEIRSKLLYIKYKSSVVSAPFTDILFIENFNRKVRVQMKDGCIETYISIDELFRKMDQRFVHCHKSFIVNMDYVRDLTKNKFVLKNGNEVPISQLRLTDTKMKFLGYLGATL